MLGQLRGQIKSIFLMILFTLAVLLMVYAIGTNDVSFNSPSDNLWFNGTNYTLGYNFTWSDPGDTSYELGNCKLYINTSSTGLVSSPNQFGGNYGVGNYTDSTIYMNKSFFDADNGVVNNNTILYWTIECCNASATPTCWSPSERTIYTDDIAPNVTILSLGFINNTWIDNNFWIYTNITDDWRSNTITVELRNSTRVIYSITTTNGTAVNLTNSSLPDGIYSDLWVYAKDQAGNYNNSALMYNITLDSTDPIVSFVNPTPAEGNVNTSSTIVVNVSITEMNVEYVIIDFDGTNNSLELSSACNATAPTTAPIVCNLTQTGLSAKRNKTIIVYVNDSANNLVQTSTRTYSIDLGGPDIKDAFNWTLSNSVVSWKFQFNDTTPTSCSAGIYDRNGVFQTLSTGTLGTIADLSNVNCTGTFNSSDISEEGSFTVQFNVTDSSGNVNITLNKSGVMTRLYSGWNTITYPDAISNLSQICGEVEFCTQVAWFNNTAKSFKTYSTSTPTANDEILVNNGDGLLIYVNTSSWIITNDNMPGAEELTAYNYSLQIPGWNLVGLLANVSMNKTLNIEATNSTGGGIGTQIGVNLTYASWRNSSAGLYYTCKRTINKCSGTSAAPKDINLRKGYGVWMLPGQNITINRSTIVG